MISWNPKRGEWPMVKVIAPSSTIGDFPESANDEDGIKEIGTVFRDPHTREVWAIDHYICIPRKGDSISLGRNEIDHIDGAIVDRVSLFGLGWKWDEAGDDVDYHGMVVCAYIDVVVIPRFTS